MDKGCRKENSCREGIEVNMKIGGERMDVSSRQTTRKRQKEDG